MRRIILFAAALLSFLTLLLSMVAPVSSSRGTLVDNFRLNDTGETRFFNNSGVTNQPSKGQDFYGQDAHYGSNKFSFRDNGDGTISDLNTGLMWQKSPSTTRRSWSEANTYCNNLTLAGKSDWRMPNIKELLSIAAFYGNMKSKTPYIDTDYFVFFYPDGSDGGRDMDVQYWSSNKYVGTTMYGDESVFGYNFADGRIKAYPIKLANGGTNVLGRYVRAVRGGNSYGSNNFVNNGDGTITDKATGLMWMKSDSKSTKNWKEALAYAESLNYAGHTDWRLPNAKELQSIIDYDKAPDATDPSKRGAAIDDIFDISAEESWFWSSSTLGDNLSEGIYLCFGRGLSAWTDNSGSQIDAHGAGAMRGDPKSGNPASYSGGRGPQGDEVRIYNYVRCVRNAEPAAAVDLQGIQLKSGSDLLEPGEKLTLKVKVKNRSSEKSQKTEVSFYLSPKAKVLKNSILLGTVDLKSLGAGKSKWLRLKETVPADLKSRYKYTVAVIDPGDMNNDPDMANNVLSLKLTS